MLLHQLCKIVSIPEHSGMPESASICFCLQIYLERTFDIYVTQRYDLVSPLVFLPPHSHLPPTSPPTTNTTMHFESPLKFSKCFHIHTPFFMSGQGNILLHLAKGHFETLREKRRYNMIFEKKGGGEFKQKKQHTH